VKVMPHDPHRPDPSQFRQRLAAGERLVGTFIKTPSSHAAEIIGDVGFDFVIIDEEHAPFDRVATDAALLGARAAGTAGIVRVASSDAAHILAALDDGAIGIMMPHVDSAAKARQLVACARYRKGRRGYSNSPRAGRYGGKDFATHIEEADAQTTVIAMIEDAEALDEIDAIVAVEGLDAIFIGRADLTLALGAMALDAAPVQRAVERICVAARKASTPVCVPAGGVVERDWYSALGATVFVVATDQAFMRRAATAALLEIKEAAVDDRN
jgi:2-keto-3-deoxy-L-rhamnonate aldolase RhmA